LLDHHPSDYVFPSQMEVSMAQQCNRFRSALYLAFAALAIAFGQLGVDPLNAQDANEAAVLRRTNVPDSRFVASDTITTVIRWMERLLGPNASREDLGRVLDWAANARVVLKPPGLTFSEQYSNRYGISSSMPFSSTSYFGVPFGVNIDPWMSVVGETKGTELNLSEMIAVLSEPQTAADGLLFPDTLRLEPTSIHKGAFSSFMASQKELGSDLQLVYVRYFVGSKKIDGAANPKPRIAYAYVSLSTSGPLTIKFGPVE
jgi:hypothetical protein